MAVVRVGVRHGSQTAIYAQDLGDLLEGSDHGAGQSIGGVAGDGAAGAQEPSQAAGCLGVELEEADELLAG